MEVVLYNGKPINMGTMLKIGALNIRVTPEFVAYNKDVFKYLDVEYVKLTNVPPWSVDNQYTGEVFELSTLNNLSKFSCAPSKEDFLNCLPGWLTIGSFEIASKEDFIDQKKNNLRAEASKRGLLMKPKYLKYPWQDPSITREPSWSGSSFSFNPSLTSFAFCGVMLYQNGQWAEIVKGKSLVDYELQLSSPSKNYEWLKLNEPKLYWSRIFSNIANDLNGTKLNILGTKYFLAYNPFNEPTVMKHETVDYGLTYFRYAGDALKAAELMGNKLEYIIPKK